MLFNTIDYILFLPAVTAVFFILPHRCRHIFLFIASCWFYMQWNPRCIALLLGCIAVTWTGAMMLDRPGNTPGLRRAVLAVCLLINLGILGIFKYAAFAAGLLNRVLIRAGAAPVRPPEIVLPVGISFFTLQALGYLIDVYRREIPAERDPVRYGLFVSFFPQLVAGPIERSKNLMHQLKEKHALRYDDVRRGLLLILYGLFLKMVIADRISPIVDAVYSDPQSWPGIAAAAATGLFAIQIYCDFYGYSVIAAGSAQLLGIRLMSNFEAPFLSASVQELWSRWHISLSTWFRDYLYIPLGGGRRGFLKKLRNLMIVFGISGLWHGASLGFVLWGLLNGLFQAVEEIRKHFFPKNGGRTAERPLGIAGALLCRVRTFVLFLAALVFFRAGGIRPALRVYEALLSGPHTEIFESGAFLSLGQGVKDFKILAAAAALLFAVDLLKYRGVRPDEKVLSLPFPLRYLCMALLFFAVLLFGCYGDTYSAQQFIYFQF